MNRALVLLTPDVIKYAVKKNTETLYDARFRLYGSVEVCDPNPKRIQTYAINSWLWHGSFSYQSLHITGSSCILKT